MTDIAAKEPWPASRWDGPPARVFARPKTLAVISIAILIAAGWLYTAIMLATALQSMPATSLGPGMGLFERLAGAGVPAWLQVLCATPFAAGAGGGIPWREAGPTFAMWTAMAFAMMLPTAAPMVLSYADAAERSAGLPTPRRTPTLLIAAGYLAVWLAFGVAATVLSIVLRPAQAPSDLILPVSRWLAALIFLGAGLYQFSAFKRACLAACREQASSAGEEPPDVGSAFAVGWRRGLDCLGCCAAVMGVMFAVGLMNVVWMAGLGIAVTVERLSTGRYVTRAIGVVFLALAVVFALLSVRFI